MKIHVVFKTHLDIGFTDDADVVINGYLDHYLPAAMRLARETRLAGGDRFAWTVGSWLIMEALDHYKGARRAALEAAIAAGDVRWHALPFTWHTEYLDAGLVRHGLSLSQVLDRRFGRQTIAAKMTDVPGHTAALVPLLAEAGVKFLHIGVNPASTVPRVPPLSRWQKDGSEVILAYEGSYGGLLTCAAADAALAFGFTGDNQGPQPAADMRAWYDAMRSQHPQAAITCSSLDAFARAVLDTSDALPVVAAEIGDTWIQGVGSDPDKTRQFRALARWRAQQLEQQPALAEQDDFRRFSTNLLLVGEHTWGRDVKQLDVPTVTFHVPGAWDKAGLARDRAAGLHDRLERSWDAQRAYITDALAALGEGPLAASARRACAWPDAPAGPWSPSDDLRLEAHGLTLRVDPATGAVIALADVRGQVWASESHPLAVFRYEVIGSARYDTYHEAYNPDLAATGFWSVPDYGKLGMEAVQREDRQWGARLESAARHADGAALQLGLTFDDEASTRYGAPRRAVMTIRLQPGAVEFDLRWFDKDASRIAEALWLRFAPPLAGIDGLRMHKLDAVIDPRAVVSGGNRSLHGCWGFHWEGPGPAWAVDMPDACLVAPGGAQLVQFSDDLPDPRAGIDVNLCNNVLGTNFCMWCEGDAVFRFRFAMPTDEGARGA